LSETNTENKVLYIITDLKWFIDDITDNHIMQRFQVRDRLKYLLEKIESEIQIEKEL
jgi:hypothetical protein